MAIVSVDTKQNIFQALIKHHDIQRGLCDDIEKLLPNNLEGAKEVYETLALELQAHAAAEERHFYVPAMRYDEGLDLSRHAITEHHQMDELMSTLSDGRTSDDKWRKTCQELLHTVRHHVNEEEDEFFKQARKILDNEQQKRLGSLYQVEHQEFEVEHQGEQ